MLLFLSFFCVFKISTAAIGLQAQSLRSIVSPPPLVAAHKLIGRLATSAYGTPWKKQPSNKENTDKKVAERGRVLQLPHILSVTLLLSGHIFTFVSKYFVD